MNKLIITLTGLILLSACQPSEGAIQTALAQTQAANPTATTTEVPSDTPEPTSTPRPTSTPSPAATAPSVESARQALIDAAVTDLSGFQDVESITLVRFNDGVFEIEIKTRWASRDSQPDVSWTIIRAFADAFSEFDKDKLDLVAGGPFTIGLTSYSTDGDYRYQSLTDWDTIQKLANKSISYNEWVIAADAGFR